MLNEDLLTALLSPDGNQRAQAEAIFNSLNASDRINGLVTRLITNDNCNHAPQIDLQLLSAVLLRREILKLTDSNMLKGLMSPLLQMFANENQSKSIRYQISHCIAEICGNISLLGDVSPVLSEILSTMEPALARLDLPSLRLLASLADRAPVAFTALAMPNLSGIVAQLSSAPSVIAREPDVIAALTEVLVNGSMASTCDKKDANLVAFATPDLDGIVVDENSPASSLGIALCQVLALVPSCACENSIHKTFQHLCQAASVCPSLLAGSKRTLEIVVATCFNVASGQSFSSDAQLSALQVLSSLLAVGDVKRRLLVTYNDLKMSLVGQLVPLCVHLVVTGVDDDLQDWASEPATLLDEDGSGWDNDQQANHAESLLAEFLQHLGRPALDVLLPLVQGLLSTDGSIGDWKRPRAGLALIETALSATPVSFAPHVPVSLGAALSLSANPNPRIMWQAVRCLGAICESDSDLRTSHGNLVLDRLAQALSTPVSKLQTIASLCVVSYCRGSQGKGDDPSLERSVVTHLGPLLSSLIQGPLSLPGMDTGSITSKVRAMGAIATIAEVAGKEFEPWYPDIMKGLLESAQLPSIELAAGAIQAATVVGESVGVNAFRNDAGKILSWIIPSLQAPTTTVPLDQLLSACARIASVLGEEFAPHIASVLPHLLRMAQQDPDISVLDGNEASLDSAERYAVERDGNGNESVTVAIPGKGVTKFSINTCTIEMKAQAIRALYTIATGMPMEHFGPHVEVCLEALVTLTSFRWSSDVRATASQACAAVFDSACAYGEHVGMSIPRRFLPRLATTIAQRIAEEDASDMESLHALADALGEIYYSVFQFRSSQLGSDILRDFTINTGSHSVQCCMKAMHSCLRRREELSKVLRGPLTGEDEQLAYIELLGVEEKVLAPLVDSVGYVMKFFGPAFIPIFEKELVPVLGPYLSAGTDIRASVSAVCLFDDCVEYCGQEAAAKYSPQLVQGILLAFGAEDKDLMEAAVYGVAQISRYAPRHVLEPHIQQILHRLINMTSCSKEEAGENIRLLENAVSALASLALICNKPFDGTKFLNRQALIDSFLTHLPLVEDYDEGKLCHSGLCDLVESRAIDVVSEAPRLARIMGEILSLVSDGEDIATPDTCARFGAILGQIPNNLPHFSSLPQEWSAAIQLAIQQASRSPVVTP